MNLMNFLKDFRVIAKIVDIELNDPNIAFYEIQLAPGIRLQKVTSLKNDLCLHFGTSLVDITPIWEKSTIAISIPLRSISIRPQEANALSQEDHLLQEAIQCILKAGQASVPILQRHFNIGYGHAARLIVEMERRGIVGPHMGNAPREILIKRK